MSAESDAALAAARAAVDMDAADGPRTHGNGPKLDGNALARGETRQKGQEHRMATESHETDKPAPAPAEVGAVVGGEVEVGTLPVGSLFQYENGEVYLRIEGAGITTHRVGSEYTGGFGSSDSSGAKCMVRPLTLRLVPAAPTPVDGTVEGCARCERTKAGYDAEIDALTKKVEARMGAERDSLKAALDKARADLAKALEARDEAESGANLKCSTCRDTLTDDEAERGAMLCDVCASVREGKSAPASDGALRRAAERFINCWRHWPAQIKGTRGAEWDDLVASVIRVIDAVEGEGSGGPDVQPIHPRPTPAWSIPLGPRQDVSRVESVVTRTRWIADAALRLACADQYNGNATGGSGPFLLACVEDEVGEQAGKYADRAAALLAAAERVAEGAES